MPLITDEEAQMRKERIAKILQVMAEGILNGKYRDVTLNMRENRVQGFVVGVEISTLKETFEQDLNDFEQATKQALLEQENAPLIPALQHEKPT